MWNTVWHVIFAGVEFCKLATFFFLDFAGSVFSGLETLIFFLEFFSVYFRDAQQVNITEYI